jgi:CRP-like cAMP-binding protein
MLKDGEEDTCYFLKENQFAVALESFQQQIPANESLQALTDCELLTLSYDKMQVLYQQIPQWQSLVAKLTEHALLTKLYHRSPLVNADAKTRYENFLRDHADIALRIPLGYVASYLGITQQSLSRLRRDRIQTSV